MTQNEMVLEYMKTFGSITPAEAYEQLGIMRLPARVHELRKAGYNIVTERVSKRKWYGKIVTFARYRLV